MPDREILDALADALEAAVQTLRERSALLRSTDTDPRSPPSATARARAVHPQLGPRQAQVIDELAKAGKEGVRTGAIVHAIGYDQPDVYLTLKGLQTLGFAEKNASARPHIYRLGPKLRDEDWP
jgi:DNA-binding MarR family transcriptional regulator